jgi:hypothetical protein
MEAAHGTSSAAAPEHTLPGKEIVFIPADGIHTVKNMGNGNAAELATYAAERGKPLVIPVKGAP